MESISEAIGTLDESTFSNPITNIQTSFGEVQIFTQARQIETNLWEKAFGQHCKDHRYYALIEDTLRGKFDYRYLVLKSNKTDDVAIQPFFFVDQDLTAGLPRHLRSMLTWVRKFHPNFLKVKMLMVGCAAGEGQLGLPQMEKNTWAIKAMHEALDIYTRRSKAPIILIKDFPSRYRPILNPFCNNGYKRVPSMPAAKLELNFSSFEDYMQKALGRIYRKNLRRKFKNSARHPQIQMEVIHDITPWIDEIYPLYQQTLSRAEFKFEELTKDFLIQIGQRMPDRTFFFIWRQNGRIIAFNLCLVHNDVLYDIDIGLDYSVALDMHLYFITWRDIIQWAIDNKLKTYYTAPLNYDPKLHLRLELAPLDLYARHTSRWINPIFKIALQFLQPVRYDPIIARFKNAHEL